MQYIIKEVPANFNIFLFGDDHEGTEARHDDGWNSMVDMIMNPYDGYKNFAVDHGDIIEAIDRLDKRYDECTTKEGSILKQISNAKRHRVPFCEKIITILDGNHPLKKNPIGEITRTVCEDLKVPFGTYSCVIDYRFKNTTIFKQYAHHGFGSVKSIAYPLTRRLTNKRISVMYKASSKFGDCVLSSMGHTHQLIIVKPERALYLKTVKGKLVQEYTKIEMMGDYLNPDMRYYVNTGSFHKTYVEGVSTYAERAGYDPVDLGFAIVKVRDKKIADIEKVII